ncbi:MAG: type II toxin-antitoxin system VapC family toxin [Planctomycetaceae bacterium]
MILLDTAYLFALFNPQDQWHARAVAWTIALQEPSLVTEYVLWEVVNGLSQRRNRDRAHAVVEQIRCDEDCRLIPASSQLLSAGLDLHRNRPDKEWSLTDCISFVVMEQQGISRALTYDHHFEQAGFEALLRRDP